MKPSLLKNEIKKCMHRDLPAFIWGEPGIGKSDLMKEIAEDEGRRLFDNRASQMEPVDVRGLPFRDGGTMRWAPPVLFPKADGSDGPAILFLDELAQGIHSVQTALFQLVRDRRVGEYTLPDDCVIVAASNRAQDRSGANRVLQALNNRFVHFDFDVDLDDWIAWAVKHGVPNSILAFIRFRPNLLSEFSPDQRSYPSPRTWEYLGKYIGEGEDLSAETEFETIKGIVGEGTAGEFTSYLRIWRKLPNIDLLIKNPMRADVPDDPAVLYAISTALASRVKEDNFKNVLQYVERMPPEYQVVTIKDSITRNAMLANTKECVTWAVENSEVMM
jgi:hypothetical protein